MNGLGVIPRRRLTPASPAAGDLIHPLRYRFVKGLVLSYRSTLSVYRVSDAGPRFLARSAEQLEGQVRLRVLEVDEEGFYLLSYFQPLRRLVDGQEALAGEPGVTYLKQDARGYVSESSDPASAAGTLLLPEEPVGAGSEWSLVQTYAPPGRSEEMDLPCRFGVDAMGDGQVQIGYALEEVRYESDLPECDGDLYTLGGGGTYHFDWERGLVVSLQTESRMTSKQEDTLLEVVTVQSLALENRGQYTD